MAKGMNPSKLLILGDSPLALAAAIAGQALKFDVQLVRREPILRQPILGTGKGPDPRAWALSPASLGFLQSLGVDPEDQAPIKAMDVWQADAQGTPLSGRLDLRQRTGKPLATLIPNAAVRTALEARLASPPSPALAPISQETVSQETVNEKNPGKTLPNPLALRAQTGAALVLICDPAWRDALPQQNRPPRSTWAYRQTALSGQVKLATPHGGIARQVFLPSGPLALLPLADDYAASLVWSLDDQALAAAKANADLPGWVSALSQQRLDFDPAALSSFPLSSDHASAYTGPGYVLLGDAAHRIHPLAGQGLNLGFADLGCLLDTLVKARRLGADLGTPLPLRDYTRRRRPRNEAMRALTDQLHHLFTQNKGPLRALRSLGMAVVNRTALGPQIVAFMADDAPLSLEIKSLEISRLSDAPPQAT